ncbi:unnamed protein product [Prorocentrum cordatum]|uniref:Uncharacterized protein n=1 Tax=Prorocentrum cordatum TaxID=2364126 RepID=A0ABN9UAK2_9DINO|nr:unnamed protein product [Polarella glacialis]
MWSSWFWEGGSLKLWQLLLAAGLAISALAIVPATCAAHYQRRGRSFCEGGADGESDEEVEEPLMASFSEALKQGPFQSCAAPASSPVQHARTGGSTPGAPLRPVVATAPAATPPLYACQLPPVHIARVTSFSQQACAQADGCSYKPLQ